MSLADWYHNRRAKMTPEERDAEDARLAALMDEDVAENIGWPPKYTWLECPDRDKHRGPMGPCEDLGVCGKCGMPTFSMRPDGETFGLHADDCSLPERHEGLCVPGGAGHPAAANVRGYWKGVDPRSPHQEG